MTLECLRNLLEGEPRYRVGQATRAVFRRGVSSFDEITTLPASLRRRLAEQNILCIEPESVRISKDGLAHKAVVCLADGKRIETVLMRSKPGLWTACVSSQVGCALACSFCATGLMGFIRNLSAEEITDQVLFWIQYLHKMRLKTSSPLRGAGEGAQQLTNVVYMGMGEPFLNVENVFESLRRLMDPECFGLGARRLSVSTVGILPGLEKFAEAFPQVNLAVSLHSARPELRARLVPADKAYPLERLKDSLRAYLRRNHRKVFVEYVLLGGVNDGVEDARALVSYLRAVAPAQLLHVNLISFNPTRTGHSPSPAESTARFMEVLRRAGQPATFRRNLGQDIAGACGQLIVEKK